MSDTIDRIKEAIARKRIILNKWEEDITRLENDQLKLKKLQEKAKELATENGNSDRFLQIMKDYEWTELQLKDVQTKVSALTTEIIELTKRLETEIVMDSVIEVASLQTITKNYVFRMYDRDHIWHDKLSACTIEIRFWQIFFKPTGKKIWIPKFLDISGDHNGSYSIAPVLSRVAVRCAGDKVGASIDIHIKIGGSPKQATETMNIGAEKSSEVEAKMEGKTEKTGFSLDFGKTESVTYNGGNVVCRFNLEYDCSGAQPSLSQKIIHIPSEQDFEAVAAKSEQDFEGDYDFYIEVEKDNL